MNRTIALKSGKTVELGLLISGGGHKFRDVRLSGSESLCVGLDDCEVGELADSILEVVKQDYESRVVRGYIKSEKLYITNGKTEELLTRVRKYISEEVLQPSGHTVEDKVRHEITEYIEGNRYIDVYGFLKFRLKFYKEAIVDFLEKSIADLELEEESQSFIEAFRHFVDIQKPKRKEVCITFGESGYSLIDGDGTPLDQEHIRQIGKDIGREELSCDEVLMGTLITTAPEAIHIYKEKSLRKDVIGVIEKIFEGKVRIYEGSKAMPI